jgi:hypothetical protein
MVITETGGCIEGATIQIVRAEGAGERIPQKTPCGAWDAVDNLWKRNRGEDRPRRVSRVLLFYRKDLTIATTITTNTTSRPTSTLASRDRVFTGES